MTTRVSRPTRWRHFEVVVPRRRVTHLVPDLDSQHSPAPTADLRHALHDGGDIALDQQLPNGPRGDYDASNAVDGDRGTRWASAWTDDASLMIKLGSTKRVSGVQLEWEDAYARDYKIQVRSGTTWKTVYSTTSGNGGTDFIPLDDVPAYKVRMVASDRATLYGYSLCEMTVVGH